jgi:hypothetical protein
MPLAISGPIIAGPIAGVPVHDIHHVEIRWRRADAGGAWSVERLLPYQRSIAIPGVERTLTYQVEARNVASTGAASPWTQQTHTIADATDTPLDPTGFAAAEGVNGIALSWTVPANQAADAQYDVERCGNSGTSPDGLWVNIATVLASAYLDPVISDGAYWYRVRAVNFLGMYSAYTTALQAGGKPNAPTSLTCVDETSAAIILSDGTAMERILVSWTLSTDPLVTAGGTYEAQMQFTGANPPSASIPSPVDNGNGTFTSAWIHLPSVGATSSRFYVDPISAADLVLIRIRAVRPNGVPSDWASVIHTIVYVQPVLYARAHPVGPQPVRGHPIIAFAASGTYLGDLEPAEAGAEKTTGKSLSILTDTTLDHVTDGSGRYAAAESGANVTSGHILTALSTMSMDYNIATTLDTLPGLGYSLTAAGTNDVFNIWGAINVDPGGTSYILTFDMYLDGFLHDSQLVGVVSGSGGWETVPYFNSFSGLSSGAHTITFKAKVNTGNLTFHASTRFICQRIW